MSILNSVLKIFVGDKSEKDVKRVQPIVDKIKAAELEMEKLSLDELRQKTVDFKAQIKQGTAEIDQAIQDITAEAEASEDIDKKEEIYAEIDALKDQSYEKT